ncbi:putative bacteriophage (putative tail completion) protein [Psychrobacter arcticus 273-4]|uniref:Putative bacteriophage (Putative tail completion) protein n=1 Tax=Psychrobacter arcticus (strain DSM 17307 / VKM B-2377 / 273-4) TaxID=259536 RepID=Q4FSZ6_PSYA2|nr:phage virion morphogenesis protein [Psychrobacter arcticus]AAZ18862.1 putative bacteriophage (putative tail completion) protein [Psychrobacter arcticus 273-4]
MFDAELSGGDEIIRRLGDLRFDSKKMQKFSRLAGAEMVHQTEERFYNQHDLERSPWIPSQRAIADQGKTLRDTGRLMASLTYVALPDGVKWGTNVVYAKSMHYGRPELNVAGRPYMGMNENDRASVLNIINRIMDVDL